jgi:hypothetical protein
MKILLAQPGIKRFQWELEILLTNIRELQPNAEIVLLFTRHDDSVPEYLAAKYNASCYVYADTRDDKSYIPSVRPFLLWQYLAADLTRQMEDYLYIDSDIIFREWLDFATLDISRKKVVGSDCDSYIGLDYVLKCRNGQYIAEKMAEICGTTIDKMRGVPGIGAQLILSSPSAEFWHRAYDDSNRLYHFFDSVDTDLQKWTAEMWAQLWGWTREGYTIEMPKEMDFCRPTDDIAEWDKVKIMHNAGVTGTGDMFFKGQYVDTMPFGEDFSYVNPEKVSRKYVDAIQKVNL